MKLVARMCDGGWSPLPHGERLVARDSTSVQNRVTADSILFHTVLEALHIASAFVASAA